MAGNINELLQQVKEKKLEYDTFSQLGELGNPKAVKPILDYLSEFNDENGWGTSPRNVAEAMMALGKLGDPKVIDPLMKIFRSSPQMQEVALDGLCELAHPRTVPFLLEVLSMRTVAFPADVTPFPGAKEAKLSMFKANAARALGKIGDPRAVPALEALIGDHHVHSGVQHAAKEALEMIAAGPGKAVSEKITAGPGKTLSRPIIMGVIVLAVLVIVIGALLVMG